MAKQKYVNHKCLLLISFFEKLVNYLESCENLLRFFFSETQFVVEVCTLKNSHHYFCLCREPPSITEQLVVKCHGARRSSSIQMLMDGTSAPFHTYHPAFLLVSFHFNRAQGPPPPALHTIPCQLLRRHCHKWFRTFTCTKLAKTTKLPDITVAQLPRDTKLPYFAPCCTMYVAGSGAQMVHSTLFILNFHLFPPM